MSTFSELVQSRRSANNFVEGVTIPQSEPRRDVLPGTSGSLGL